MRDFQVNQMIFFRFPFSETILTTDKNSDVSSVSFFSFDKHEKIDFKGNINEISVNNFLQKSFFSADVACELKDFDEETETEYLQKLQKVIEFIKENDLAKLVISRRKLIENPSINLSETFLNLCKSYPNAFAYFFIKDGKCWLGAFSEVLGKFNKLNGDFETMSLAGTIPVEEHWTNKEIEEQKPVTNFIQNILSRYSDEVQKSETYDHISGNIKHLRTDFKAKINSTDLESLIAMLHPTPAVCGIPKDICQNAIQQFEKHPRKLYAGYIKVETKKEILYFVNLRCAEFFRNAALVYVGGGITAESSPEKEWCETELKSQAILRNIHS